MSKITQQIAKNFVQFLKIIFSCSRIKATLRSAYLLGSEFQTIIRTLCRDKGQNFIHQLA